MERSRSWSRSIASPRRPPGASRLHMLDDPRGGRRITPSHHALASRPRITPSHHALASRPRVTPSHHALGSCPRIVPSHQARAVWRPRSVVRRPGRTAQATCKGRCPRQRLMCHETPEAGGRCHEMAEAGGRSHEMAEAGAGAGSSGRLDESQSSPSCNPSPDVAQQDWM